MAGRRARVQYGIVGRRYNSWTPPDVPWTTAGYVGRRLRRRSGGAGSRAVKFLAASLIVCTGFASELTHTPMDVNRAPTTLFCFQDTHVRLILCHRLFQDILPFVS